MGYLLQHDGRGRKRFSQNAQQAAGGKVSYFTYDPLGRMIRSGEMAQVFASLDANAAYAYDGLYRLKTFNLGATHARAYAYDDNGNVTSVVTDSDRLPSSGAKTPGSW